MKGTLSFGKVLVGAVVVAVLGGGYYAVTNLQNTELRSKAAPINAVKECAAKCKLVANARGKGQCTLECNNANNANWNCKSAICQKYPSIKSCDQFCGRISKMHVPKGYAIVEFKKQEVPAGGNISVSNTTSQEPPTTVTKLVKGTKSIMITQQPVRALVCEGETKVYDTVSACYMETPSTQGTELTKTIEYEKDGLMYKIEITDNTVTETDIKEFIKTVK